MSNKIQLGNELPKFAVKILHQYAEETQVLPRSTSDLSKLEEWLIIQIFKKETNVKENKME